MNTTPEYKIHYIAVFYIGPNRNYTSYQHLFKTDPLMMLRKHAEFLNSADKNITSATFVFNNDIDTRLREQINSFTGFNLPTRIGYYGGPGFSYGAWNEVMKKRLEVCDYFFLIEDDYLPTRPDFYKPFVERCNDEFPYVCTYVEEKSPGKFCASSSNALVKTTQCKFVFEKYGEIFTSLDCSTLEQAWATQTNFLNLFTQEGYKMRDILDEYKTPHMLNCNNNYLVTFGKPDAEALIEPIIVPLVE